MKKNASSDYPYSRKPIGIVYPSRQRSSLSSFPKRPMENDYNTAEQKRRRTDFQWIPVDKLLVLD
jgi:hypothetical protein